MHRCGRAAGAALAALAVASLAACAQRGAIPTAAAPALRIGSSGDYAPFTVARDGTWSGMDIEVAQRFARDTGRPLAFERLGWTDIAEAVGRGEVDAAMGGITMRPERALAGRYTRPYASVGTVVLVRARDGRRFAGAADLDRPGVRIAVNAGGHLEHVARALFPRAAIRPVEDNRDVPQRLLDGRADAAVTDTAEVREWMRPSLRAIGPLRADHKAYLLPPGDVALADRFDAWLIAREQDGWLDAERVRWLGDAAAADMAAAAREAVAAFIRLRLALMPAVAAAKRTAGLPIEDRGQEAQVIERVRAQASRAGYGAAVYRQLIALAKAVQGAAPPPDFAAALPALRDAIARIDQQLVRELDRAPATPADVWRAVLARDLNDAPGVTPQDVQRLATALAR